MVRKQLYLTEAQDAALKRRATEAGISEAEVVRRALEVALRGAPTRRWRPGRHQAMADLAETWAAPDAVLVDAFDRDALYEARLAALTPRREGGDHR